MRVHYLQHVPFEGLGSIGPWLEVGGHQISRTKLYESTALPTPEKFDLLIIMGGPMSVNDEDRFPWLRTEKQFVRHSIEAGKAVLGICLGAQLIANSLGESVYPNRRKEIGWFPIEGIAHKNRSLFSFPPKTDVFHWHGETFDLPEKAVLLAKSAACENQAFQLDQKVIGLQFHLETTPASAESIVTNCRQELLPSIFVQPKSVILDQPPSKYRGINQLMGKLLLFLEQKITDSMS